ncbi:hypothetical protein [Niabella hibiscisoli]|uniref:hypothetical protein n=1 Tax=Niabella hibiscisoli TaxID=1825928 RepID=UPI001F0CE85A|nr:hypothetical protein [Niabella hibiscisoli]MCH5715941.1 hypothetical protein [Niabella hibiscisoli]
MLPHRQRSFVNLSRFEKRSGLNFTSFIIVHLQIVFIGKIVLYSLYNRFKTRHHEKIFFCYLFVLIIFLAPSCSKNDASSSLSSNETEEKERANFDKNAFNQDTEEPIDNPATIIHAVETFYGVDLEAAIPPSTELEAQAHTQTLMTNSVALLDYVYGIDHSELVDIFDYTDNPEIGYAAMALTILTELPPNMYSVGMNPCNSNEKIVKCAVAAFLPCDIFEWMEGKITDQIRGATFTQFWNSLSYSEKRLY